MAIVNDTNDDIGYDTDPPAFRAQLAFQAVTAAAGMALIVAGAVQGNVAFAVIGAALLVFGAVGLDRTLRQQRELLEPQFVPRLERFDEDSRPPAAGTVRSFGVGNTCGKLLPAHSMVLEPAVFPPGTTIRFCDPSGEMFGSVDVGDPVTVSYSDDRADEMHSLISTQVLTISKSTTGQYSISVT